MRWLPAQIPTVNKCDVHYALIVDGQMQKYPAIRARKRSRTALVVLHSLHVYPLLSASVTASRLFQYAQACAKKFDKKYRAGKT